MIQVVTKNIYNLDIIISFLQNLYKTIILYKFSEREESIDNSNLSIELELKEKKTKLTLNELKPNLFEISLVAFFPWEFSKTKKMKFLITLTKLF